MWLVVDAGGRLGPRQGLLLGVPMPGLSPWLRFFVVWSLRVFPATQWVNGAKVSVPARKADLYCLRLPSLRDHSAA